jgi:uncharacterized phage-associated protein
MPFEFDLKKALQATAVLLRLAGTSRTANYMRLIKLLYLADRRSLQETGRPITGDRPVALERGPVLGRVLDLIRGKHARSPEWARYVETDGYHVRLLEDPGNGELSPYEVELLQAIWDEHRAKDEWDLVRETHELPEWKKNDPGSSSKPIPLADILEAVGRSGDLQAIEEDARQTSALNKLYGG